LTRAEVAGKVRQHVETFVAARRAGREDGADLDVVLTVCRSARIVAHRAAGAMTDPRADAVGRVVELVLDSDAPDPVVAQAIMGLV
jgi:hypothetical protein